MSNVNVVTTQPTPTAPPCENVLDKPSGIEEKVVLTQPMLSENINDMLTKAEQGVESPLNERLKQPILNGEMLAKAEAERAIMERRRRRNDDFCCFVCADSYSGDDSFCWYFFCKMLCNGCGHCCEGIAHCTDSCCEGCAECCHNCCDEQEGCCESSPGGDGGCDGGDGCDGCCDGCDAGGCDCNCFD